MVNLEGLFVPFNGAGPVLLRSGTDVIMPLFSSREKYLEAIDWAKLQNANCNAIVDGQQFLQAITDLKSKIKFHVALDPFITEEGNTRFQLLKIGE